MSPAEQCLARAKLQKHWDGGTLKQSWEDLSSTSTCFFQQLYLSHAQRDSALNVEKETMCVELGDYQHLLSDDRDCD